MSDVTCSNSDDERVDYHICEEGDGDSDLDYHTCDEDNEAGVPPAASPSSSSSDDGREWLEYHHTSDEEEEDELDVVGAAPAVTIKKITRQLHTSSVTGIIQDFQDVLLSCNQPNTQLLTSGSKPAGDSLAVDSGNAVRVVPTGTSNTTLNVQLNVTQQQFGDVTVEKATHVNQMFGGSQNISKTATIYEGQKGRELSRVDLIMKRTIRHFQDWNKGMVRTAALDQVLEKLDSGTTWLTIKGNPGEGKSTVGYMALEELHKQGREVFEVSSPDDFTEIIEICPRPVIMLDDVFGNLEFDQAEWSKWKPVLSRLMKEREHRSHEKEDTSSKKDVTVILIGRDYVLNSASVDLGRLSDFLTSHKHVVYMDYSVKRGIKEKYAIWETISRSSGVELDDKIVNHITRIKVPHGFPHVCRLFTTMFQENKAISVIEFFNKPLEFLNATVSNFFKDTSKLLLFKEMVKCQGRVSLRELRNEDSTYKITQAAYSLVGTYIKVEEEYFVFDHPSIYDSVAFHMCSLDPKFVIQQCNLSFIHERVRILFSEERTSSNSSQSHLVVYINSSHVDDLAERFAAEIKERNFVNVLSHQAFTDRTFVNKVMSLLRSTDKKLSLWHSNTFLSLVPSCKSPELLKYIDNCPDIEMAPVDEKAVLYGTCRLAASDVLTYLINTRKSLNMNTRFNFDKTLLMIAAETRDVHFVHQILCLNPDLNAKDSVGKTILHYLCKDKLVSAMIRVIDSGVDIDVRDYLGCSPLHYACINNQLEVVKLLIEKGARVDKTSVKEVCRVGNIHMVELLFEKENNPSTKDILDCSLSAASLGGKLGIMCLLVRNDASVNNAYSYLPPLHAASCGQQPQAVQWLLQHGADVNSPDKRGNTALHRAAGRKSQECVGLLLKSGATASIQNIVGDTALHKAAGRGSKECVDLLTVAEATVNVQNKVGDAALHRAAGRGSNGCVDLLLKAGATADLKNNKGNTALHKAAGAGSKECINLLLKAGATVDMQNMIGDTACHKATGGGYERCIELLHNAGATMNIKNEQGNTALHRAAEIRSKRCVYLLMKLGLTVNIQNKGGETALHIAAGKCSEECVDLLLKAGCKSDTQDTYDDTHDTSGRKSQDCADLSLKTCVTVKEQNKKNIRSAERGSQECVDLILKEGDIINIQDKKGRTALNKAEECGYEKCVDLVLTATATVNLQNIYGNTALHLPAAGGSLKCVKLLLQAGANVNTQNKTGDTALHGAARSKSHDCVDLLLKAGATVNTHNKTSDTALHRAAESGSIESVNLLLKADDTVNLQNTYGNTALHRAARRHSQYFVATVNTQNNEGDTALHIAAEYGSKECVDLLLKAGAEVNLHNTYGNTELHKAAGSGSIDYMNMLLKAGATVNLQNQKGNTAIHEAAVLESNACVALLLKAGAPANIQNHKGNTPLHRAAGWGSKECIYLLLKTGVKVDVQNDEGDIALLSSSGVGM